MAGYALEFKRNFECRTEPDLEKLVLLGSVNTSNVYECDATNSSIRENTARSTMERVAATVEPPPRGQDVRKPVDGVSSFSSFPLFFPFGFGCSGKHEEGTDVV